MERELKQERVEDILKKRREIFRQKRKRFKRAETEKAKTHLLNDPLFLWKERRKLSKDGLRPGARDFSNHWARVFGEGEELSEPDPEPEPPKQFIFLYKQVTDRLKGMDRKKAAGLDGISPQQLDLCFCHSPISRFLLFVFFNLMHAYAYWPDNWNLLRIVPVPKGPPSPQPNDWRPVHVVNPFAKLFGLLMDDRIRQQARFDDRQIGFRKGVGTREGIGAVVGLV
mmetsp:Transcript_30446/g.59826  ORF Transcript_30446/g.59826 Transcript_30446/m.59826 type:complete len:226 (-) Transcript_30446:260-937(-)